LNSEGKHNCLVHHMGVLLAATPCSWLSGPAHNKQERFWDRVTGCPFKVSEPQDMSKRRNSMYEKGVLGPS
jgi:hypothetical protein